MNFSCDKCQRRYSIADDKVRGKTVKVRCKNCQNVISVEGPPLAVEESTRVVSLADVERLRSQLLEESEAMPATGAASEPPATQGPWEDSGRPAAATEPALESPLEPPPPSASAWFVMVRGQQEGPLEEPALRELLSSGSVTPRSYFWQQGMDDWKRGSDIAELASLFQPAPRPAGRTPPRPPEEPLAPPLDENLPATRPHSAADLGLEDASRKPTVQWDNTEVTVRKRMEEVAQEEAALEQGGGRRKPPADSKAPAGRRPTHEAEARSAPERRASPEARRPVPMESRVTSEIPASDRAWMTGDEGDASEELPQPSSPATEARRPTAELPAKEARRPSTEVAANGARKPPAEGTVTGVRRPPTEGTVTGVRRPGEGTGSRRLTEDTASVRLGSLFSDLDLPQGEAPGQPGQGQAPDPFAEAAQEPLPDMEEHRPEEDTRFFMRKSGVDRRNPPWKIALFVVLVLALPVGVLYALTELQVVPLRTVRVDDKGNQVEQPVSLFTTEGVAGLRDLLLGRQQPPPPPPPPAPKPKPEAAAPKPEPKPEPEAPAEPAPPSAEEQQKLAELYGADKQDAAPQVREGADVAATDSARATGPSKAALDQAVQKAKRSFQDCVNRLLKDNRSFRGLEVNITVTVAMTGKVKQATFDSREVERSKLGECLKARAMKLPFTAFSGEDVAVEIPLVLKQSL